MTKARLGEDATDPERRLTRHLVPFREVIPSEDLDFNQLLQRDLDDHRVAINLVPYLLNPAKNGPAFFPPILAILLPFQYQRPSSFPVLDNVGSVTDSGLDWDESVAGDAVKMRRLLVDGSREVNPIPLGEVHWNSEFARLVVVDGQHRAMALLAVDRTMRSAWQGTRGARYKYFYESTITDMLSDGASVSDLEVPVTIVWFPEMFGPGHEPHKAARKLFVDVNKEARTPSESRLILLSDTQLSNIFVRTALSTLRNDAGGGFLPLYSIEYDNPDTKTTQSARWSAMTNIHALKLMVLRAVFGPPKYINDMTAQIGRREPLDEMDTFMRMQLDVETLFPAVVDESEEFARTSLGNADFPESAVEPMSARFMETWGFSLLTLLSEIHPYRAHAQALRVLKQNWIADDAISSLAFDAVFGGVGMFWTLREAATHWQENVAAPGRSSTAEKPDVVRAWELIAVRQTEFEELRAKELLGSASRKDDAARVYQAVNTHACQLGLALSFASLFCVAREDGLTPQELAIPLASTVNFWMNSRTHGKYDRRLALSKRASNSPKWPLNLIANMDMPRAVQFRYFWLEIFACPAGEEHLTGLIRRDKLEILRDEARSAYVAYVTQEKQKALRTTRPELNLQNREELARREANREIREALLKWFDLDEEKLEAWFSSLSASQESVIDPENEVDEPSTFDENDASVE
nr:DNA sulfur modification protein DndB [uncultured Williamsia sp.]